MRHTIFLACIFSLFAFICCTKEKNEVICTITSPADDAVFSEDQSIAVKVEAITGKNGIANVQLFIDDSPFQFLVSPPYTFTIPQGTISIGSHTLKATAQDEKGNQGIATKTITVKAKEIKIGDFYQGGIVAYIDYTGRHGLIAAPYDQNTGIAWSKYSVMPYFTGARGTSIGTGKSNTDEIIQYLGAGQYAAIVCDALVLNDYDDWFLPSKDELNELFKNKDFIGSFANAYYSYYWSSTDGIYDTQAWCQDFYSGAQHSDSRTGIKRVRAVRYF